MDKNKKTVHVRENGNRLKVEVIDEKSNFTIKKTFENEAQLFNYLDGKYSNFDLFVEPSLLPRFAEMTDIKIMQQLTDKIREYISEVLPERFDFTLLVYKHKKASDGVIGVSNSEREESIQAMKEVIKKEKKTDFFTK